MISHIKRRGVNDLHGTPPPARSSRSTSTTRRALRSAAARPAQPSYFLKPSSLGRGDPAARSNARPAPSCSPSRARSRSSSARPRGASRSRTRGAHVASVTAANDFGLYDLRATDKGSNVRSKGGDGFTPIGPALIDAARDRPGRAAGAHVGQRRARPGRHDRRACSSRSRQLVADLSQHFTLETGDVILTGTPAGSSVVVPGDVVEVEVDAPDAPGARPPAASSRPSPQGAAAFAALGVAARRRRPASAPRRGATAGRGRAERERRATACAPHRELRDEARARRRRRAQRAAAQARAEQRHDRRRPADARRRRSSSARRRRCASSRTARTCSTRHGGGYNAQKRAFDTVGEGEIIVIEARGETGIRHARRHPRAARPGARRRRHRHRRRRPRLRRGRRASASRVYSRARTRGARPPARAVGRRRDDRMRRHRRAARRRHRGRRRRRHRDPAARSPRRSPTRRSRRRTRTRGSPSRSRRGIPSTGSSR